MNLIHSFHYWQQALSTKRQWILYVLILMLWAAFFSNTYNIDLLTYWQGGEGFLLLLSLFPTMILLHLFHLMKWWGLIPLSAWLFIVTLQNHILHVMNFRMSFGIISNIFETNVSEANGFITVQNTITFLSIFLLSFMCLYTLKLVQPERKSKGLFFSSLVFISGGILLILPAEASVRGAALWPIHNLTEITQLVTHYWTKERTLMKSLQELPSSEEGAILVRDYDDLIVIFHFGESSRADHWSLYGYTRPTTPHLVEQQEAGNLIYFPNTLSYAAGTRLGVVGILTPAELNNRFPTHNAFFDAFKKTQFKLKAYRSNQKSDDQTYDSTLKTVLKSFAHVHNESGYADSLLPQLQQDIQESNSKSLLFYYGEGSHAPYEYDKKHAYFLPDNMNPSSYGENHETLFNRYDNTIRATDHFIGKLLQSLKNKPALYIYTSDHGEFLGEDGRYSHGDNTMNTRAIRSVPLFIWASPAFQSQAAEQFQTLKKKAHTLPCISHDHIYHTVLGLSGIKNNAYNEQLDLSSPKAKAYTGPMPEDIPPHDLFESLVPPSL